MPYWKHALFVVIAIAVGLFVFNLYGCTPASSQSAERTLSSALDVIGDTVGPTSKLARKACSARMDAEVQAVREGRSTTAQAEPTIAAIQSRCDALSAVFRDIRLAHTQAAQLVEERAWEEATQKILELRKKLSILQEVEATP